jgi:hypothetical protein
MKKVLIGIACSVMLWPVVLQAQQTKPGAEKVARQPGGIATLYVLDPLSRALCFRDGREGMSISKNRWGDRCSDLSYTLAGGGSLVSGLEAERIAAIVDLGSPDELRERYGYEDADGGGEGFASLQLQSGKIVILKEDNPNETLQPLKEGPTLFTDTGPSANAPIKLGHIYILRIADRKDGNFQVIVKFMVVAYQPDQSVTLRWAQL